MAKELNIIPEISQTTSPIQNKLSQPLFMSPYPGANTCSHSQRKQGATSNIKAKKFSFSCVLLVSMILFQAIQAATLVPNSGDTLSVQVSSYLKLHKFSHRFRLQNQFATITPQLLQIQQSQNFTLSSSHFQITQDTILRFVCRSLIQQR